MRQETVGTVLLAFTCPSQPGVTLGVIDASDRPYYAGRAGQWLLPPPELLKLRCALAAARATVTGPISWTLVRAGGPSPAGGSWNEQAPGLLIRHRREPRHEPVRAGSLHHVGLPVPDLARPDEQWGWLLGEQSPALTASDHDRLRPGMSHLAFHAHSRASVDAPYHSATSTRLDAAPPRRHPHAGGQHHCAAYLSHVDGFEVELIASEHFEIFGVLTDPRVAPRPGSSAARNWQRHRRSR